RKSIEHGERLAIHRVGDKALIHRGSLKIKRFQKLFGPEALGSFAEIESLKLHLNRAALDSGRGEDVAQASSRPHCVTHGTVSPLPAGQAWLEAAAAVTGALIHGRDGFRAEPVHQLGQAERKGSGNVAFDAKAPCFQVNGIRDAIK